MIRILQNDFINIPFETMKTHLRIIFSSLFLFSLLQNIDAQETTLQYIFIGHPYQGGTEGDKVDYRIENFNFFEYEGIWLGGDVCSEATLKYSTVEYIDSIFDLSDDMTFWALGNHDTRNGNWEWIRKFTKRETYYSQNKNNITSIVMNTNLVLSDCYNVNNQYKMIKNVCDTINESSHLILLMHHGIWNNVPNLPIPSNYAHSSLPYWNANCYDVESNFYNVIYPLLVEVENKGIEVVCIMGDMGASAKFFEMQSVDGITFLGCGLYDNSPDDLVLIFEHNINQKLLSWNFYNLNELINEQ